MSCAWVEQRLVAWQDGELSPGEHTRVGEHLETCRSCRRLERDLARVTPRPAAPVPSEATAALFARMDAALARAWDEPAPAPVLPRWAAPIGMPGATVVAYAALLLLTVAWGTYNWRAARSLQVALDASRPVVAGHVIPARSQGTPDAALTDGQFTPAAWVPDAEDR